MKNYRVILKKTLVLKVNAETADEAWEKAEKFTNEHIDGCERWQVSDIFADADLLDIETTVK